MKKIFILFSAVLISLTACNKPEAPELSLSENAGSINADGGTLSFSVNANNEWNLTTDGQTWYTVSPTACSGNCHVVVTVDPFMAAGGRSATLTIVSAGLTQRFSLAQASPVPPADPSHESVLLNGSGRDVTFHPLAGFEYVVDNAASWISVKKTDASEIVLTLADNNSGESRSADVVQKTTDGNTLKTFSITQDWKKALAGELLIEEIFFTGHLTESGSQTSSDGDQYFKITNNSDELIYADGLLVVFSESSSNTATTGAQWTYPVLTDRIGVNSIYRIPGSGKDVPVKPGESLLLALTAQDFTQGGGFDLSKADFEFVDLNDYVQDPDNPDVPNLENWFKSSRSITVLHNRGMESYAIAFAPPAMTAEAFMADYPWNGTRVMDWNGHHFEREIQDAYLIPNDWVVDGVNGAVPEALGNLWWNPDVDSGWTGVGETQNDAGRYGKGVRRKVENGKLADSNNSTNDFTRNAVPSLAK